jgi:hypothetical protein
MPGGDFDGDGALDHAVYVRRIRERPAIPGAEARKPGDVNELERELRDDPQREERAQDEQ